MYRKATKFRLQKYLQSYNNDNEEGDGLDDWVGISFFCECVCSNNLAPFPLDKYIWQHDRENSQA